MKPILFILLIVPGITFGLEPLFKPFENDLAVPPPLLTDENPETPETEITLTAEDSKRSF